MLQAIGNDPLNHDDDQTFLKGDFKRDSKNCCPRRFAVNNLKNLEKFLYHEQAMKE